MSLDLHLLTPFNAAGEGGMRICGAYERELPNDAYSEEQRGRRQSSRRCAECVASGKQLVLMKKGRTRPEGDNCLICQLPLPLDVDQSSFYECCMKEMCHGCVFSAMKRGMWDCPFCRKPMHMIESQALAAIQKRVDAGDPVAMWHLGFKYLFAKNGLERDVVRAIELQERAAELGLKEANYGLGVMYAKGIDVEKDLAKAFRHYEAAAMCGHVSARHHLGCEEDNAGNHDLALQHWMISSNMGHEDSLNDVKASFIDGHATKADYAAALRGYQDAIEEMSSPDRAEAKA